MGGEKQENVKEIARTALPKPGTFVRIVLSAPSPWNEWSWHMPENQSRLTEHSVTLPTMVAWWRESWRLQT